MNLKTKDERSPGAEVIEVFLALEVHQVGSFSSLDDPRGPTHCLPGAYGAVDPTRDPVVCTGQ